MVSLDYLQYEKEGLKLDRKRASIAPKKIAKHFSAFANAAGGDLVVGIEDDGEISGFKYPTSEPIVKYLEAPADFLMRVPDYQIERIAVKNASGEDDEILVFHIEPSRKGIIALRDDSVFLRVNDESRRLNHSQIIQLERHQRVQWL